MPASRSRRVAPNDRIPEGAPGIHSRARRPSRGEAERGLNQMPIRINKVYTRTGDKGETHLVGGKRVPKDDPRIDSYGTIDELNASLGIVRAFNDAAPKSPIAARLDAILRQVQNELFDLGSELATPPDAEWD